MDAKRRFLKEVLTSGRAHSMFTADDVLRHVTPLELSENLPVSTQAALIGASVAADTMDADLIVDTVGLDVLAEYVPTSLLWQIVTGAVAAALGGDVRKVHHLQFCGSLR